MADEDDQFAESTGLEKEQIVVLRRAFDSFDRDKKGYISPETVSDILRMMGIKVSSTSFKQIIEEIDEDGSGQIEFPEFLQLSAKFLIEEDEEAMLKELKEAFRLYDKEGNGYITTTTLKEILQELDPRLTADELVGIIDEIDEDGSGTVDFDGNGYITTQTLKEILHEIDSKLTEEDLNNIIEEVDEDGSGTLDFDEFMAMMTG